MKKFKLGVVLFTIACLLLTSMSAFATITVPNETNNADWADFQRLEIDVVANTVTVSGLCASAHATNITVWIYETETENDLIYRQFVSQEDGSFNMKFVLNTNWYDGDNTATIKVAAENTDTYSYEGINLYSLEELQACVEEFKGINDADSFSEFMTDNLQLLGREDAFTAEELEGLYEVYVDGAYTADDTDGVLNAITDIINIYAKRLSLYTEINVAADQGDGNQIKMLLTSKYKDILTFEIDNSKIFIEADLWKRMTEDETLGAEVEYASMSDIRDAYMAAYDAQLASDRQTGAVVTEKGIKFVEDAWKLVFKANVVTLVGQLAETGARNVTVYAYPANDDSKVILVQQFKSVAKTGAFEVVMPLNSERFNGADEAILKVSAVGADIWSFYVPLYAQSDVDTMIDEFKSIDSVAELEAFLTNELYVEMLGHGVFDEDELKVLFELYEERKDSYDRIIKGVQIADEVADLETTMYSVFNFINDMNDVVKTRRWGNIRATIESEYAYMAEKIEAYAELITLTKDKGVKSEKGLYERLFNKKFVTIGDVIDEFIKARDAQKEFEALEKPASTGGAGGGGGGGRGSSVVIGSENKQETNESVTTESGTKLPSTVDAEKLPVGPFSDITDSYSWAADAINGLRTKGYVRGDGDGKYRPGSTITREEFLSILLNAYGIEIKSGDVSFSDVAKDAWYKDVIYTAVEMGIVNGIGNNKFGTGKNISRIDMVVMAARAAETLGVKFAQTEKAVIFADYRDIPEYGYNYVVTFQQADFINGDDTGNFNANKALTRAEAAVLFWNIVSYLN